MAHKSRLDKSLLTEYGCDVLSADTAVRRIQVIVSHRGTEARRTVEKRNCDANDLWQLDPVDLIDCMPLFGSFVSTRTQASAGNRTPA